MKYFTDDYISKYIRLIQPKYDGILGDIQEEALNAEIPIIPHETARFLSTLLTVKRPKEILEIGTAVAFSAGLMCRYIQPEGHVTTIDRYELMLAEAEKNVKRLGLEDKITIIRGDAAEVLKKLEGPYDFVFLDAAKGQYIQFLPDILRLMPIGGVFVADDVLQGGNIAKSRFTLPRRQRTIHKRMRNFLWDISHLDCLEYSIIPIGDGIVFCTKIKEYIPEEGEFSDD